MESAKTDRLIQTLAREATRDIGPRVSLVRTVLFTAAMSLVVAVALCFILFGAAGDLRATLANHWFYQKLVCMGAVAIGAFGLVQDLARPGFAPLRLAKLLPAAGLLLLGLVADPSSLPVAGRSPVSVPICVAAIVGLALPGLGLMLVSLRKAAASTRPALAGMATGLLAGAIGGAAYAFACRNDGGLFIAIWYGAALVVTAGLGAVAGRRLLSW